MPFNLKVLTLNVWGIRYISKDVSIRYFELIKALKNSDYDIIALQEVWLFDDFEVIRKSLREIYPHSNYFHSGLNGSGCCLLSKHVITETFQARYSVNGIPYKVQHGDWLGGKCVGLARIQFHDVNVSVYTTHLHANYTSKEHDEYLAHRISQAYELSQFISLTSDNADFVLLMGDLNLMPDQLGFKILRDNAFLFDSFVEAKSNPNGSYNSATCFATTNYYVTLRDKALFPNGQRIDYILFKNSINFRSTCLNYELHFGRIPGKSINYSDHEGVFAEFSIEKAETSKNKHSSFDEYTKHNEEIKGRLKNELIEAFNTIDASMKSIYSDKRLFTTLGMISFIFIFLFNQDFMLTFLKTIFLSGFCIFCIWYVAIQKNIETRHLLSVQSSMKFKLKSRYNHEMRSLHEKKSID